MVLRYLISRLQHLTSSDTMETGWLESSVQNEYSKSAKFYSILLYNVSKFCNDERRLYEETREIYWVSKCRCFLLYYVVIVMYGTYNI